MSHPFPQLQQYPNDGLSFAWAAYEGGGSSFTATLGPDGVGVGMIMDIHWGDLEKALQELLGYSYREPSASGSGAFIIKRVLPWQHPYLNQLVVKRVDRVQGIRNEGNSVSDPEDIDWIVGSGISFGIGAPTNYGPWSEYHLARLTISFWRPPYYLRTDADILDVFGQPQEWLRYVDKNWSISTTMLSKENSTYAWAGGPTVAPTNVNFSGSVGIPISHSRVVRRWYQVPEACIFSIIDSVPVGTPDNFLYMQSETQNPITGYTITPSTTPGDAAYQAYPIPGTVNSPIGGGVDDSDSELRMFGCRMGTLLFLGAEFTPRDLQLPPYLMNIPVFANNEAISQVQYDVTLMFDLFDPPRSRAISEDDTGTMPLTGAIVNQACRGHNLMPWSGNGMWYPVTTQNPAGGTSAATPFNYADFRDLFTVL